MVLLRFEWHNPVSWKLKLPPPPPRGLIPNMRNVSLIKLASAGRSDPFLDSNTLVFILKGSGDLLEVTRTPHCFGTIEEVEEIMCFKHMRLNTDFK